MNKRGKIISFWGAHYSIFDGAVSGWCELTFFSLFYFGRRESCLGRAPSYSSRGREAARETRERRGELLFLSGIVYFNPGIWFCPHIGRIDYLSHLPLSPSLLFSSPPHSTSRRSALLWRQSLTALLPAPALLPMRGAQHALRSSSLPFSYCLSLIVPSAASPCRCSSKELDPACLCSSSLLASVGRWKLLNSGAIAVLRFPGCSCFLGLVELVGCVAVYSLWIWKTKLSSSRCSPISVRYGW